MLNLKNAMPNRNELFDIEYNIIWIFHNTAGGKKMSQIEIETRRNKIKNISKTTSILV